MELSELLALVQYEVQKSYDFAEDLAKRDTEPSSSVLQIALERVELDLPISLTSIEKTFNRSAKELQPLPTFTKVFKLPYLPERLSVIGKGKVPKGEIKGKALEVELLGPVEKVDETRTAENTGRIKIIIKPVMK